MNSQINEIKLTGSGSLLKKERKNLIQSYQNQCLSLADIEKLRVKINNFYIEKGYIMSRVYLIPNQQLKEGILEFEIKEGEIEEIRINENSLIKGNQLIDLDIPERTIVVMVKRDGKYFVPYGKTVLHVGDILLVIADDYATLDETFKQLSV